MIDQTETALPKTALLARVQQMAEPDEEHEASLGELARLAETMGLEIVGRITQKRDRFDPGGYFGQGKREDLKALVAATEAGLVLLDHEVSPSQARNLEKECGALVMDRTGVILEIFRRHAHSRAAKAQVEIVRLKYLAPRLREQGASEQREKAGAVGRSSGESKMELDRRKIRDRIAELSQELEDMEADGETRRARRRASNRVALVGYTNAGKSTLMRALTGSDVLVANRLFATLDTTVRRLHPETRPEILVSDTVGFIKNLPHGLVRSFKSTLEEALEASILLHVVDASDPGRDRELAVTEEVLTEIGAGDVPRILVWNKIDAVGDAAAQAVRRAELLAAHPTAVVMSALRKDDVASLRQALIDAFAKDMVEVQLFVPWDRQALRGEIFEAGQVLGELHDETGTTFRLLAPQASIDKLRSQLPPA